MAEYTEVIKQFKRMCWYYSRDKEQKSCSICKSYPNCNIGQCRKIAFEQPSCFKDIVMAWAAEHPDPVYPTWGQYFRRYYGLEYCKGHEMLLENIPADIAQKLGIEPKEG